MLTHKCLTESSQSQAQLPTTLHLQSSSTLGTGKASTNRERLEKLEDKETRRAIEGHAGKRKRNGDIFDVLDADDDVDDEVEDMEMGDVPIATNGQKGVVVGSGSMSSTTQLVASTSSTVGSALQRKPDGSVVAPRIAKKKQRGKKVDIPPSYTGTRLMSVFTDNFLELE